MLVHPHIDPIAFKIGPLFGIGPIAVHWYGLMYLVGFLSLYALGRWRIGKGTAAPGIDKTLLDDLLFFGVLGVIAGGRLGYILFYKLGHYLEHPLEIFAVWQGGMSFHGGFLGVLVAMWWVARKHQLRWLTLTDFLAPLVPLGLGAGRIGNFINGELWGRVAPDSLPWAMIFPSAGREPRHPSQLYQFALEGLLLFAILWLYSAKPRPTGAVSAVFLIGYGLFRFIAEYFREPDDFLGLLALNMSMGQWLSIPMVLAGLVMLRMAYKKRGNPEALA
ncbi:MAG TPA: prolipoprotein diacylglyceryl transferase [Burkholderiales bacterium]|nr:prolipoprotein diacylglyceryl transferase [Burkholderiales bacterium]